MKTKYGRFSDAQIDDYREKLHKRLFWLLLYRDPNTRDNFSYVDFDSYFKFLMRELNGLNALLLYPSGLPELLAVLQAAYEESKKTPFDYGVYRKLVLDSHSLLDRIDWGREAS